ncbi:MAG: type II secretion system F family protein [Lachnospiraceae bacterium]|nr:type II secretion system F family protein [Lachnospiraceae bacterium]
MKFQYTAVDLNGKKIKGIVEAENEAAAIYQIRNDELSPISVKPYKEKAKNFWEIEIMEPEVHQLKMKKKDLMQFADKMAIMMRAGVNLSMAMDVMIASEKNRRYKKIYRSMLQDLYGGLSLADSMRTYKAFPESVVNMVASSEKNGQLDWAFTRVAEMYEKELALSGKLSSAFAYPAFLIVLAIALFIVMTVVVLPKFEDMYAMFEGELPALTKGVMAASDFLIKYGIFIAIGLVVIGVLLALFLKVSQNFTKTISKLVLKIPVYGRLTMVSNTCSFSRVASALLQSGVEVVESVRIASTTIKNRYIRTCVESSLQDVSQGSTLYGALAKLNIFEPLFISMVQIGEEASMLPDTFQKMADLYEAETNESTRKLTSILEPTLTLVIGLVIAILVVSIILPMFNMYTTILG